jgi:serine/threonine protein kinase
MNSTVFLATDPQLQGPIAVKEIPKSSLGNSVVQYFEEARTMFASAHPNVVPIQYACQTAAHVCLAMPYYPAGSLASQISAQPLALREIIRVGDGVLSGLAQVHLKGFLHLDVKPTNVLFGGNGCPMLADFGQARQIAQNGTVQVPRMYIHAWPPEVATLGAATVESDVFQAGLLLYRAANGDPWYQQQIPPSNELVGKITRGKFPDRSAFMPHVPAGLKRVIRKALRVDPAERYGSATEMAQALGRIQFQLDWRTSLLPCGGMEWRAERGSQPDLVVQLRHDTTSFRVEAHTVRTGSRRAKRPNEFFREFRKRQLAINHLSRVFEELR